jgi:hypothetical protein
MANRSRHSQEGLLVDRLRGVRTDDPSDAAHAQLPGSRMMEGACRYSVATRRRSISR